MLENHGRSAVPPCGRFHRNIGTGAVPRSDFDLILICRKFLEFFEFF
jgi:hypothetical protein